MKSIKNKVAELSKGQFYTVLDNCILSPEDKKIAEMIYIKAKDLNYIADILGYSLRTINRKHDIIKKQLLSKMSTL